MSCVPEDLKYTKEHQWVKVDGDLATIGITDHAQSQLGDVVYVELPKVGLVIRKGDVIATIESIKAITEVYSPLTGEVVSSNKDLEEFPKPINDSPYQGGWIAVIRIDNPTELSDLLDADEYCRLIGD